MGADRAILMVAADDVQTDIEPLAVAKLLKGVIVKEESQGWSCAASRPSTTTWAPPGRCWAR